LEQICEGKGYIDMSTVDAETSLKINEVESCVLKMMRIRLRKG